MIVDFHTHIFPDELAPRAIEVLTDVEEPYIPVSDGTAAGLLENMDVWGIDVSVISPVVVKQSQMEKVNEWVASVASERFVSVV